ncbi:MAG: hypothetical protein J6N76_10205, partial [Lachnospiraceae bacterium]|nr:hypothetical protein [Lachnospiraceae bacterium]
MSGEPSLYKFKEKNNEELQMQQEAVSENISMDLQHQQNVEENLQDQEMKFSDMTEQMLQIESKSYTFFDGKTEKVAARETKANSTMSRVMDTLKDMNDFLSGNITIEELKEEKTAETAQGKFLEVCKACRTYLRSHRKRPWTAEGRARRQMVEDLLERTSKESVEFYER